MNKNEICQLLKREFTLNIEGCFNDSNIYEMNNMTIHYINNQFI